MVLSVDVVGVQVTLLIPDSLVKKLSNILIKSLSHNHILDFIILLAAVGARILAATAINYLILNLQLNLLKDLVNLLRLHLIHDFGPIVAAKHLIRLLDRPTPLLLLDALRHRALRRLALLLGEAALQVFEVIPILYGCD